MDHHEYRKNIIAEAKRTKPFAPENGQPLKYNIGDRVTYINPDGAEFKGHRITGFYTDDDSYYARGARYYVDLDCHWVGISEDELRLEHMGTEADPQTRES